MNISIIIPAYNEESTIASVILDFNHYYPEAKIYVIDNNSTDKTKEKIHEVINSKNTNTYYIFEPQKGKGAAIRKAFQIVDTEIIVIVDADSTYSAKDLPGMISYFVENNVDILVGDRLSSGQYYEENKRIFHGFGNNLVRDTINFLYSSKISDPMSGYRILSKKFKNNYTILYNGFELETDMTIHALDKNLIIHEVPIEYKDRPAGSYSKLSTYRDGLKVILVIFNLFRYYKPFHFFIYISIFLIVLSLLSGLLPVLDFINYGYVHHVPLAILASSIFILSMLIAVCGLILDAIARNNKIMFYKSWNDV
jgi:glycosyltransferase involved in cell wall biosynthesis